MVEIKANKIVLNKNSENYDDDLNKAISIKEEVVSNTFKKIMPVI